jgi:Flp pilus assembly protein TadG
MILRRLTTDTKGATAAEFGIVLPLFILFLLGIIDVGRWLWTYNHLEKATQMGARMAVVTNASVGTEAAKTGLYASYIGVGGLTQGDNIPPSALGKITCTSGSCTCTTTPCPALGAFSSADFTRVANDMKLFYHEVQPTNVTIEYSSSGLGFAGNPNGPDVAPVVTVRLSGMTFTPLACELVGCSFAMPAFVSSLTYEDGIGSQSN